MSLEALNISLKADLKYIYTVTFASFLYICFLLSFLTSLFLCYLFLTTSLCFFFSPWFSFPCFNYLLISGNTQAVFVAVVVVLHFVRKPFTYQAFILNTFCLKFFLTYVFCFKHLSTMRLILNSLSVHVPPRKTP